MMRLLEKELTDVFLAAESVFAQLTVWRRERFAVETLSAALDQLVTRIDELYLSGAFRVFQVDEITALYGHRDALSTLGTSLTDLQSVFQQLSDVRISVKPQRSSKERQRIDRSWIIADRLQQVPAERMGDALTRVSRYLATAEALMECTQLISTLHREEFISDSVL